jgi:hypothetical protein
VTFSPLEIITKGVVEQPHVEVAELGLRLQYHELANGFTFVGGHFLIAVPISTLGKPPHLGSNLGVGNLQMKVGDAGLDSPEFGQIVKRAIREHNQPTVEYNAFNATGGCPSHGAFLLSIVALLPPTGRPNDPL